jgi:hypothetical protein
VHDDAGASGNEGLRALAREWRRAVPETVGVSGDCAAAVIAAVREWPSLFAGLGESGGRGGTTVSGDRAALPAVRDLMRHPAGPGQYQTLALLAGAFLWLSRELGRPQAELLDEMAGALGNVARTVSKRAGARPVRTSGGVRAGGGSEMKVVAALRELLSCVPVPGEDAGRGDTAASGGPGALPAVTDLVQNPDRLAQYQSLALLAGVVMALSRESGRREAEILDELTTARRPGA